LLDYGPQVLGFDCDAAQLWARLRMPLDSPTKAAAVASSEDTATTWKRLPISIPAAWG
jgi:hypothetical protein